MRRLTVAELLQNKSEKEVIIKGWVHRIRDLGGVVFILIRDRTGIIQTVWDKSVIPGDIAPEAIVNLKGKIVIEPRALNGIELRGEEMEVINPAHNIPFSISSDELEVNLDTLLKYRVLSLRHPRQQAIFKIRHGILQAFRQFLTAKGFIEINSPKIVATGTEGGSQLFTVNYFDQKAYLAQSPQFYKQMLVGAGFERVYEIGPAFRAELHATKRHTNEFISLDLEMGFINDENDLMELEEEFLVYMIEYIKENYVSELNLLDVDLPEIKNIPRLTFNEVLEILKSEFNKDADIKDLSPEDERLICRYINEAEGSEFVFITCYPEEKRPMYTMPHQEKPGYTRSFDLLFRGQEVTTGGQRIHNKELLQRNITGRGLDPDDFKDYLEVFGWGMPPHGGLAIGLERMTMQLLNLHNIREATFFPRDRNRLRP